MTVGLVGAGNMARALAHGWQEPVLCFDPETGRARSLADEVGGRACASNAALAAEADVIVLAHKPPQLADVAEQMGDAVAGKTVVSLLARTDVASLRAAYPRSAVVRVQPNLAVEVRSGVTVMAAPDAESEQAAAEAEALFERVGAVVRVPDALVDVAGGCSGVGPAYWSLLVEAQVDAAVRHGLTPDQAARLVGETMTGTGALLRQRGWDTLGVRRGVTSPGGTTARGLAALERAGVRAAFATALDEVVGTS